ncbi:MAG: DNA polymerase III subunit gamma/tau [Oscillospiraceae bacterium]|nr:DNA polymerase III subunit gamma/tau [Oscillospiraceae bacterium]
MYQVLYRKYRPKVFSDVVGQSHITSTLSNEVKTGKLSHAYLFTGSRGTGKTTCAKILAKAVNCLHPVNGNPCGECEICKGIESGAILDVVEIDAASNNGVDNIRDIRDESAFAPASCKYRVYIIDEVHMLSIGAFNALLKTLEEPPAHVKFILATTEVHKIPATILSRCQRFDFKRVDSESMVSRMQFIADEEGFTLDEEAALLIAKIADGGMRDALSVLDQCVSREKHITTETVCSVAGLTGRQHLFDLADAVKKEDAAACLSLINELHNGCFDMERLCSELINHFRNLMITKTVKNAESVLIGTQQELDSYKKQSASFTLEALLFAIDLLQNTLTEIKRGANRRVEMETAVIRLAHPALSDDRNGILRRLADLEAKVRSGVTVKYTEPVKTQIESFESNERAENTRSAERTESVNTSPAYAEPQEPQTNEAKPLPPEPETPQAKPTQTAEHPTEDTADIMLEEWPQVLSELSRINMPLKAILTGSVAYIRNDFVLIKSENPTFSSFIKTGRNARDVKEAILRTTGRSYRLGIYTPKAEAEPKEQKKADPLDSFLEKAKGLGVNIQTE